MPPLRRAPTELADALVAVAPLVTRWIERLLAGHDPPLTVAQFLTLRAIASGAVSGSDLASRSGTSGPAVSQLLAGLAEAGLLERREFEDDRRRQALALSAGGRRTLASAQRLLRTRLSAMLGELPHPEADALARALPRVEATLSGAAPPRRPRPPAGRPPGPPHRRR
jgi:DNA-binding MarR family transcriptional regulator